MSERSCVDGPAVRLREQEAAQGPAVGIESIRLVPEPQEHLLDDLLGLRGVVEQSLREPEHRSGVAAIDLAERLLLVASERDDERCIRRNHQILSHALCSEPRPVWITCQTGHRLDVVRVREQVEHGGDGVGPAERRQQRRVTCEGDRVAADEHQDPSARPIERASRRLAQAVA